MKEVLPELATDTREESYRPFERAVTIMEAVVVYPEGQSVDEGRMSDGFDRALEAVAMVQRGYHAATKRPVQIIQREKLFPMMPVATTRQVNGVEEDATVGVMILHGNVPEMEHPPPISDVEWGRTQFATGADPAPFLSYVDIRREADGALMRGEYGTASVLAATASEVFLETLILHLLWSEGKTPAEAAALVMDRGLATRVRTDYHGRLGGQWSCAGKGSVAAWSEKTAKLRHRVVHAGYRPTRAESIQSLEAMHGLDKFVADKLCSPSKLKL